MKKLVVGVCSFILCITILGMVSNTVINAEDTWEDYKIGEEDLYNETNTYEYHFVDNEDEPNQYYDMTSYNGQSISNGAPLITVLTPGLNERASAWSRNENNVFTYLEDSLITRLSNMVGGANIYWYKMDLNDGLIIIDISSQIEEIKKGTMTSFDSEKNLLQDSEGKSRITDISKPIIILFESSLPASTNDYVYEEFNYAISKAVYDVKVISNGVLPKINLIGHSRGGITNLQYALDHPELVHSMYSIGTPYLGSTSAKLDIEFELGFGPIDKSGELNILDKELFIGYLNEWNNNYESLYQNIDVHALGGYSSIRFFEESLDSDETIIIILKSILIYCETMMAISSTLPIDRNTIENQLTKYIVEQLSAYYATDSAIASLCDILFNEVCLKFNFPFVFIENDGLVDLASQLGEKQINYQQVSYKGFTRKSFCFTEENSDRTARAMDNYPVVHNLETRHKDILDYIVKNISMSGKINSLYETYEIGTNQIGIRAITQSVTHTTLQIPKTINGKTVTEIADSAFVNDFNGNTTINKVIIPNTITRIGSNAFGDCSNLKTINFETNSSLYEIGDYAFYNCTSLVSINTPSSVVNIGEMIFLNNKLILDDEYNSDIFSSVNDIGSINCMVEEIRDDYNLYNNFSLYFKFTVECEYEYDFNVIAEEGIKLWLYDSNMELLFDESTSINNGTNLSIIENLTPGDYYLRITAADGNYTGEVEVIIDNDINAREELIVDTSADALEHLHDGHNEFFFMKNKSDFYEFLLMAEVDGEIVFPQGAITILDSSNNIVEKFAIPTLEYSDNADSINGASSIIMLVEAYKNYYINIDVDPNIEYSSLEFIVLPLSEKNFNSYNTISSTYGITGDKLEIINVEKTAHYNVDITYNGNQTNDLLYVILKKDSNNNFELIDSFLLNSENDAVGDDYIFGAGDIIYIGYFNLFDGGTISLEISRIIKQKFGLIIDPNPNVMVGTEVTINNGEYASTTLTQGYTRICYLGMYAPALESRTFYEWSSTDESVAKVSSYGTITGTATWTGNETSKTAKIIATYKYNRTIVGEIEVTVLKDTKTDIVYLKYGMDVREVDPVAGTEVTSGKGYPIPISTSPIVTIHKDKKRLICLGNDSPSKIIQDFEWTSLEPAVAVVSQYGTITAYHSGEAEILGVYKYNSRFKVLIKIVVITP